MYALPENFRSRPLILKILFRSWDYHYARTFAGIRYVAGAWNFFFGALLWTYGYYWGAAVMAAGVALVAVATLLLAVARPTPPRPQPAVPTM